ncbi:hypothetical protein SLEP1_g31648 [Rubroshorea leprosula]|uniref:Glycosyltransferase n=1 Tax=Rubroshorea leprosula TaxID=152421 RepID=A0AAV5K3Y1_9ROSI|nr:hypothetical protein SLEP1_g31648 [Rubroshorea leprosula]
MEKAELIFIPVPGIGHLVSTVELAKRLLHRDDRISVTLLSMKAPFGSVDAYTKPLTASEPRIRLVDLPPVTHPSLDLFTKSAEAYIYSLIEVQIPQVRKTVTDIVSSCSVSGSSRVVGLVLDFFCVPMIDIANELELPCYMFLTTNTGFLSLMMELPIRHGQNRAEVESSDPEFLIPGFVNPVPVNVLPSAMFNKFGGYTAYLKLAQRFKDTKGIIVNALEELEPYAIEYFTNSQHPPIYPVGPVLDLNGQPNPDLDIAQCDKVMKWLDDQPQSSVVFLCFGSMGSFEPPQVREIALGLEQSGYRFLWSLRLSPPNNKDALEDMLPEGFLGRIGEKGMICEWAPQVEVLAHKATGGFVSHCGWNSILESLWYGVPIVTWPMYAEQQLNAFLMVKELGLAVELKLDYRSHGDLVMAGEIEKALHHVMDGSSEVRVRVKEMSDIAKKAIKDGGSSFLSIGRLIEDMVGKKIVDV